MSPLLRYCQILNVCLRIMTYVVCNLHHHALDLVCHDILMLTASMDTNCTTKHTCKRANLQIISPGAQLRHRCKVLLPCNSNLFFDILGRFARGRMSSTGTSPCASPVSIVVYEGLVVVGILSQMLDDGISNVPCFADVTINLIRERCE